tara:strand:- start:6 stop:428 length:423 start_codon:yes stop_codon:yes gene_type:complete
MTSTELINMDIYNAPIGDELEYHKRIVKDLVQRVFMDKNNKNKTLSSIFKGHKQHIELFNDFWFQYSDCFDIPYFKKGSNKNNIDECFRAEYDDNVLGQKKEINRKWIISQLEKTFNWDMFDTDLSNFVCELDINNYSKL